MTALQAASVQTPAQALADIPEVDAETVNRWLDEDQAILVDVRETSEYEQEHIPGSMLVPLSVFNPERFPRITGKKLVLHCAVGKRSAAAALQLRKAGYLPPAINLAGGIRAWKDAGLHTEIQDLAPIVGHQPAPAPASAPHADSAENEGPAVHPGRVLVTEYMEPLAISQERLAADIDVAPRQIWEVVEGVRPVDTDLAFRLARYFSTCEEFWLRLQMAFDLEKARHDLGGKINRRIKPVKAA